MLTHTCTNITNILVLVSLLLVFLVFSRLQRRPLFLTEFQFGGNWKQVWLCFFISGGAGLLSLSGMLVSVGPVGHAQLQWVMSSSVLAGFGALYLYLCVCVGDSFAPSVNLIHQPGSRLTPENHSPFPVTHSLSFRHYVSLKKWELFTRVYCTLQKVFRRGRKKSWSQLDQQFFLKRQINICTPERSM